MIVKQQDVGRKFELQMENGTLLVGTVRAIDTERLAGPSFTVEDVTGQLHAVEMRSGKVMKPR